MDYSDFTILSELMRNPLETYEKLGSAAGMRGVSARNRVKNMERSGLIRGIHLVPSPLSFGRIASSYVFNRVADAQSMLPTLLDVEDVVFAWTDHENDVVVNAYHKDAGNGAMIREKLREILGDCEHSSFTPTSLLPPIMSHSGLSSIDWKLLEHMVAEPRLPVTDLSRLTGLSRKTVNIHRNQLIVERKVYPVFLSDFTKGRDHILYGAVVIFDNQNVMDQLSQFNMVRVWTMNNPSGVYFLGFADTLRDVENVRYRVSEMKDIKGFSISIPTGGIFGLQRIRNWIREAIEQWKTASFSRT